MKKISFFIGTLLEGGAERVVSMLANQLVNRDFDVEILKYYESDNFYPLDEKIKVLSVENQNYSRNILKNIIWLKKYFKSTDLIISFLAPFNMMALYSNKTNKTPIIVADRNDPYKTPTKAYLRIIRNTIYELYADKVVLQTETNKEYFNTKIQNKSVVIPNPVTLKEYAAKATNHLKNNKIVSVGRLMKQKNHILLIEAFNNIKDKYNDYQLYIYGEGPYRSVLENKIKELNLTDKVFLPGKHKDVFDKILDAKLFILTSDYEGMPNALIEAMCLGLPVISTKVSGANELIEDNINGILINSNVEQLTAKIDELLSNDLLRQSLGNNAIKLNEQLNIDSITDKWIDLIKDLI